jgi:hypothetical protein
MDVERGSCILIPISSNLVESGIENFTTLCTLVADISRVSKKPVKNANGTTYFTLDYDVVLNFGLSELQAQLRWWEGVSTFKFVHFMWGELMFCCAAERGALVCTNTLLLSPSQLLY